MQNNKYIKLYAAFKAGYMGQNILNTYFPFFANILHEKHIEVIDEYLLQKEFHNKYNFEPTIPFIRQVLSVGLENKSIKKVANNYISDFSELKNYCLNTDDFESNLNKLIYEFKKYCSDNKIGYDTINTEDDLMRSHSMVNDALMNVTKGDYARFNDRTYLDVYEEIKSQAREEYLIEVEKHNQTKKDLQNIIFENNLLTQKNAELSGEFNSLKEDFENYKNAQIQKEEKQFNSRSAFIGNCIAFILLIVPYVFILVKLEFVKAKYAAQVTKGNIIYLTFAVIISLVVAFLYIQLKKIIVILVRKVMSKYK